jgi:hypothetical protein
MRFFLIGLKIKNLIDVSRNSHIGIHLFVSYYPECFQDKSKKKTFTGRGCLQILFGREQTPGLCVKHKQ